MHSYCLLVLAIVAVIYCTATPFGGRGGGGSFVNNGYSAFPDFGAAGNAASNTGQQGGMYGSGIYSPQLNQPTGRAVPGLGGGGYAGSPVGGPYGGASGYGGLGQYLAGTGVGGRAAYGLSQPPPQADAAPMARGGYGGGGGGGDGYGGGGGGGYGGDGGGGYGGGGYGPYTNIQPGYFLGPHYYGGFLNQGIPRPPIGLYKNGRPLGDYAPDIFPNITQGNGSNSYGDGGYGYGGGGGGSYGSRGGGYGGGGGGYGLQGRSAPVQLTNLPAPDLSGNYATADNGTPAVAMQTMTTF